MNDLFLAIYLLILNLFIYLNLFTHCNQTEENFNLAFET